ncbi:hypothetical protein SAMN05444266_11424 [Chitinophaga jiangningensis]|uniref:Dolichyl-phosphate-mannose-protein mannosyltransferase n=1 Tax=Chitinophaga jiangningensis TaxID=1419482 RepID=A0A1M7MPQ6_9BACT|nr:hypothetical protein [Chitinophaga jiangningensis]SHM92922.1 hypothetical protein SAMN05444266_11424 [Chitinophaga jiangningensis]
MERRLLLILGIGGYVLLLLITILHRQPPLFDEPLFVRNLYLFDKEGLSARFLLEMNDQAPGPLYQLIHYPLYAVTHWQTPGIRLVNMTLLAGITFLLIRIITLQYKVKSGTAIIYAANIMAVPMIWQISGMALTEIPPIFFSTLAIYWLLLSINRADQSVTRTVLYAVVAGVATGLAILGRSPFLILIPSSYILLWYYRRYKLSWISIGIYTIVALSICMPVFLIWKGLVPPKQALVAAGGINLWHGILAFAYGALLTIIIAPAWFVINRRITIGLVLFYVLLLVLNITVLHYSFAPLSKAVGKVFPAAVTNVYPYIISPALATVAIYYVACCAWQAWQRKSEPVFLFLLSCCMLMLATNLKVTHLFSSRYVGQAAAFLIILLVPYDKFTYSKCIRFALGMIIGLLSLETYFLFR